MTGRTLVACTLLAGLAAIGTRIPSVAPLADTGVAAAIPQASTSSLEDQTALSITVYNSDLALVRDVRRIRLATGVSDLQFMDIAATVKAPSVHFRSLADPAAVRVLEQNYEYDLLDPQKLLRKYVGREVTLVRTVSGANGRIAEEPVTATLLSYNEAPVWRINGEVVTGLSANHIRFPELPATLHARPTLIWTLENRGGRDHQVEAAYLATKLSWNADYVLTVARDDAHADLDGWVTVVNGSGTSFPRATLQLVAGELNRVRARFDQAVNEVAARRAASPAASMEEESLSEYHLYTMARPTTINNNQTKQVSLLNASGFAVRKRYVVTGDGFMYRAPHPGSVVRDPVQVFYELKNEARGGLGMPLPAGTVRVYQADSKGGAQFVGEDRLSHTPKDETVNLKIGHAFDVTSERVQTEFARVSDNTFECAYRITLRNHRNAPVTVEVNEPFGGTWRITRSSVPGTRTSSTSAQFLVPVAVDGTAILEYRVRTTY